MSCLGLVILYFASLFILRQWIYKYILQVFEWKQSIFGCRHSSSRNYVWPNQLLDKPWYRVHSIQSKKTRNYTNVAEYVFTASPIFTTRMRIVTGRKVVSVFVFILTNCSLYLGKSSRRAYLLVPNFLVKQRLSSKFYTKYAPYHIFSVFRIGLFHVQFLIS